MVRAVVDAGKHHVRRAVHQTVMARCTQSVGVPLTLKNHSPPACRQQPISELEAPFWSSLNHHSDVAQA